jgi:glycine zipper 2TM protein
MSERFRYIMQHVLPEERMTMTGNQWMRLSAALSLAAVLGCAKGEQANQSADSTARNLTLAPTESTAAMKDVPAPTPTPPPPPEPKPERRLPPRPPAPTSYTLRAGTEMSLSADDSITTRHAHAGDPFTATVSENVRDPSGHVVIPAGSAVSGTIVHADPAPNPRASGQLDLAVTSVTVRGRSYTVEGTVESKDTVMQGRGVTGADAAKVGGGAAIGAIAGRLLGGNKKGTIIGGLAGAAAGAVAASRSRDVDVVLPKGAGIRVRLASALTVSAR